MRPSAAFWIATALVAATAAVAAWAWVSLPPGAGVPVNYLGLDGHRHAAVSRGLLWLLPLVSAMVTLGLTGAARRPGAEAAAQPLEMTMIAVAGLLLVTQNALTGRAFQPDFDVLRPVTVAAGVLLLAIGNHLGKARRNAVFGLRTPWTLADATVWDRTHRFTGVAMVLGGLVLIGLGFLLRDAETLGLSIGACTAIPLLAGVVRSASLHRNLQRG
ncbi:MAG: SdpI family protein [Phenylobacterium sp.]